LDCQSNQLTTLNVSSLPQLQALFCNDNTLTSLYIKNGSIENILLFYGNPDLNYICADQAQLANVQQEVLLNGLTCTVDAACALQTNAFEFSNSFTLYPNPASYDITIKSKDDITIQALAIYNMLGQMVRQIENTGNETTFDVSGWKEGTYLVRITTNAGMASAKFIKTN